MDFLDISSLGAPYRYYVKIEKTFRHQNKREFRYENTQQPKYGKEGPNNHPSENKSNTHENKGKRNTNKDIGKW